MLNELHFQIVVAFFVVQNYSVTLNSEIFAEVSEVSAVNHSKDFIISKWTNKYCRLNIGLNNRDFKTY